MPVGNLHVTLGFLGNRASEDAAVVRAKLANLAHPLRELRTAGAGAVPTAQAKLLRTRTGSPRAASSTSRLETSSGWTPRST